MIVIMKTSATSEQIQHVVSVIEELGYAADLSEGSERAIIGIVGSGRPIQHDPIARQIGVERIIRVTKQYKLASREFKPRDSIVKVGDLPIGGPDIAIIAGPCAVENRSQLLETAHAVKEAGAHMLRAGAFKPRISPYSFQGLGVEGLKYLAEAREVTGLPVVTEVIDPALVPAVQEVADVLQIGARSMQNYALLHAVGRSQCPVLLKRGMSNSVEEWLLSAEYILSHGNPNVILCERGIRTFEESTLYSLDINAIPVVKQLSHLPVIADPSHATGRWAYVGAVGKAAVAAGADGVMVEVHPHPDEALSDGLQSLKPERFAEMVGQLKAVAAAVGRDVIETG